jgi:hypothetical protein
MLKLSYSSLTQLQGCQRKYYYRKVKKYAPDFDADTDALITGKIYHSLLEVSGHTKPTREHAEAVLNVPEYGEAIAKNHEIFASALACAYGYARLRDKYPVRLLAAEKEIQSDNFLGYIDAIVEDDDGWYILDLKTAAMINERKAAQLHRDLQLNLYVAQLHQLELDPFAFRGCLYNVVQKSKQKRYSNEKFTEYAERANTQCVEFFIPHQKMNIQAAIEMHERYHIIAEQLHGNIEDHEVPQNFGYCESFFKPCEFWSKCYGNKHDDFVTEIRR